tara:strand:- start:1241 stop:2833 length:1593 start_codon:yes stop_codon:yes gene_type:complete
MGLFGGDFGSGFATGLAESVDQSLKTALDKREKEMSRAREFWMTRQAQKMDLADDHDKRAGDALDAFITEFNGDVAKGLAAYKHFKTVDGAEAGLKEIEDTRAALGEFNVNDYFSFEGIDLGQFADLSREDAFASIRAEVKPLDIQMQDTGLLSKIGLGDSDMGGKVSSQINELIPARTRTAIKGLTGAAFDRSGTITSMTQRNALENQIVRGEERAFLLSGYIASGQDAFGNKLDEHDILQYQKERSQIYETLGSISVAKAAGDKTSTGPTSASILSGLTKQLTQLENDLQFSKTGNVVSIVKRGENDPTVDGAMDYWNQESTRTKVDFIKTNILDANGEFVSTEAQEAANLGMLADEVALAQQEIKEAKAASEAEDGPGEGEGSLDAAEGSAAAGEEAASAETEDTFEPVAVGTGDFTVTSESQLNSFIKNFPEDYVQGAINSGVVLNRDALEARLTELGVEPAKIQAALALVPQQSVSTEGLEPVAARPTMGINVRNASEASRIREEQAAWDAQYGQTHNRDGSVKG